VAHRPGVAPVAAPVRHAEISPCQHLTQSEGERFGAQLALRAASERLVPIMMTILTTGFAVIPLLVAGSIPGQEIEHPMAVVIFGGLITATLAQPVRRTVVVPAVRKEPAQVAAICCAIMSQIRRSDRRPYIKIAQVCQVPVVR
jgi:Cu/Ag efflux pump CusA